MSEQLELIIQLLTEIRDLLEEQPYEIEFVSDLDLDTEH